MKFKIVEFKKTVDKLKSQGISKLSQQEKDEIDANYRVWLKKEKKRRDTPLEFNDYIKNELGLKEIWGGPYADAQTRSMTDKKILKRITAKQIGGDDGYCWAVMIDGRPMVKGLTRPEVAHYKKKAYDILAGKK